MAVGWESLSIGKALNPVKIQLEVLNLYSLSHFPKPSSVPDRFRLPGHYRLTASPHSAAQLPCCWWSVSLRNWNRRMTFGQEGRNAQRSAATWCQRGENLNFMLNRILPAGGSTSTSKVRTLQDKTICVQPLIRLQRTSGPCYQAVKLNNTCFTDDGFFQVSADPTVSCL